MISRNIRYGLHLFLLVLLGSSWLVAAYGGSPREVQAAGLSAVNPTQHRPGFYVLGSPELDPDVYHIEGNLGVWHWSQLHSSSGFNFNSVETFLNRHAAAGRATGIMISTYEGRCCGGVNAIPSHLHNSETVVTLSNGQKVPKYWSTTYQNAYRSFVQAFGERYRNDSRLHYVAIGTGIFGETRPTDSQDRNAVEAAGLTSDLWVTTVNNITQMYVDAFSDSQGNLLKPLLLQAAPRHKYDSERREFADYALDRGVGISINGLYATMNGVIRPAINHCQAGRTIRHCGMYDIILRDAYGEPSYEKVPIAFETYGYMLPDRKHFRWGILSGLNKRADYIRVRFDLLYANNNPENIIEDNNAIMAWAKQYMGVTAATTPAVWVALREHTNPWYSPVLGGNGESAHTYQAGNYEFWLNQVEVDGGRTLAETNDSRLTMPVYNAQLPPAGANYDQNPEAWVIRRTQQEIGEHRMYFAVDDRFMRGGSNAVMITVVYWDNRNNDRWQLWYDSTSGPKAAHPKFNDGTVSPNPWVEKQGSGQFRRVVFHINDARFNNAFAGGTDFYIDSRSASGQLDGNEWIHYVEVRRLGTALTPYPITGQTSVEPPVDPPPSSCYDFTGDGKVTSADVQLVVSHWGLRLGDLGYNSQFDVNGDNIINMLDVQIVARHWNESCS